MMLTIYPTTNENKKAGGIVSIATKYTPIPSISEKTNFERIVMINPAIIEAIAPLAVNPFQNNDMIIIGQNIAAIPDQPNITNQKIVLVGDKKEITKAIANAIAAKIMVNHRENLADFTPSSSALNI
ncbi:MAG TPA: hypothetical protein P5227_12080, partial [Emcibacteraceae bacterium]|nr:hypothetical protein [Emcibacteraceae bacterium]